MTPTTRRLATAAVLTALAAGCAGIPDSGGAHAGRRLAAVGGLEQDDIRVLPAPPRPGMSPTAVVTGFLRALVYRENSYGIARAYLAPATTWRPSANVTTYDDAQLSVTRTAAGAVTIRAPRAGVIDSRGEYRRASGELIEQFGLARQDGEWRINRPPATVALSSQDANRSLQAASVYYLNREQNRLVPDQLLLSVEPAGLATTLVRTLLAGPAPPLASAVHTAVPIGTPLQGNVPVDDSGVAEVDLPVLARQLPPVALARLSAQLVWTLKQISGITGLRLLADGRALAAPGVPSLQPLTAWQSYDPSGPVSSAAAVVVRHGVAAAVGGRPPHALAGRRVTAPAVSQDGSEVAALRPGMKGQRLLAGSAAGRLTTRLRAPAMTAPAFDPAGDVLVVTQGHAPRLVMVPPAAPPRTVSLPAGVLRAGITAVRVSRDGSRIAMVVGPTGRRSLLVGLLAPVHGGPAVTDVHAVIPGSADASGLAWSDAGDLVTTVRADAARVVMRTDVDGYQQETLPRTGLPAGVDGVAAAPRRPVLASDGHGVWSLDGVVWHRVSTGDQPVYPG